MKNVYAFLTILFVLSFGASLAEAGTCDTCTHFNDEEWTTDQAITSDRVYCGATLEIDAGVTVTLDAGVSICVKDNGPDDPGMLRIDGGILNPNRVRFVTEDEDPWGCLIVDNSADDNLIKGTVFDYGGNCSEAQTYLYAMVTIVDSEVDVQLAKMQYAKNDYNDGRGLLIAGDSNVDVQYADIRNNDGAGILVYDTDDILFWHINVQDNDQGIHIMTGSTGNEMGYGNIHDNETVGIYVGGGSSLYAENTTVEGNCCGAWSYLGSPTYYGAGIIYGINIAGGNDWSAVSPDDNTIYNNGSWDVYNAATTWVNFYNVDWFNTPPNIQGNVYY
jgi:hypothetical protein